MPDPEIYRRCASCGASVRSRAAFCPQCGERIPGQPEPTQDQKLPDLNETQPLRAVPNIGETLPLRNIQDFAETQPLSAVVPTALNQPPVESPPRPVVHRAPEPAPRGPVGKLRKASSVVLDQAAYDPSLRFLLVAAVLFLLFVVLLIFSKVMG